MVRAPLVVVVVATALWVAGAPEAHATDVCVVQKSSDRFVALRSEPSPRGALLVRAKPGHAVVIQKSSNGEILQRSGWLRVRYFADSVAPQADSPAAARGTVGWMHRRYVNDCG